MARSFAHKALRILEPVDRERPAIRKLRDRLGDEVAGFLGSAKGPYLAALLAAYEPPKSGAGPEGRKELTDAQVEDEVRRLLALLDEEVWKGMPKEVQGTLEKIAQDGGLAGLRQVDADDIDAMLKLVNERAVEWAEARAADMVGMKWVDGALVPNPNAAWSIADATRESIRSDVTSAMREGWSNGRLANELRDGYGFSRSRADMVARTESAYADASANMAAWKESGVVRGKVWLRSNEGFECDICEANAQAGEIPIDAEFPSGDQEEPAHPRCKCITAPVVNE